MVPLACGTPVIAFRRGALSEIIEHGHTGFLVDTVEERPMRSRQQTKFTRTSAGEPRARFSARRMASQYLQLYERLATASKAMGRRNNPRTAAG
jgi:glycosyltransferase involved in cell wall biosynthesis